MTLSTGRQALTGWAWSRGWNLSWRSTSETASLPLSQKKRTPNWPGSKHGCGRRNWWRLSRRVADPMRRSWNFWQLTQTENNNNYPRRRQIRQGETMWELKIQEVYNLTEPDNLRGSRKKSPRRRRGRWGSDCWYRAALVPCHKRSPCCRRRRCSDDRYPCLHRAGTDRWARGKSHPADELQVRRQVEIIWKMLELTKYSSNQVETL